MQCRLHTAGDRLPSRTPQIGAALEDLSPELTVIQSMGISTPAMVERPRKVNRLVLHREKGPAVAWARLRVKEN